MQANCTNCQQRIVIDDAKVPDRAFSVKCPKCQTVVRFPGKGGAPVVSAPGTSSFASNLPAGAYPASPPTSAFPAYPNAPAAASAGPPSSAPAPPPAAADAPASEEMRATMMAQIRREMSIGEGKMAGRAMVALSDRGQAGAMALHLTRLGYHVDTVDNAEEGARLLEQGMYDLVVAVRTPVAGGRESLYQRLNRLSPGAPLTHLSRDRRRRVQDRRRHAGLGVMADVVIARATSRTRTACCSRPWPSVRLYQVFLTPGSATGLRGSAASGHQRGGWLRGFD